MLQVQQGTPIPSPHRKLVAPKRAIRRSSRSLARLDPVVVLASDVFKIWSL